MSTSLSSTYNNELILNFIQLIATVSTVGVFLIPLKTILNIKEKKTTGQVAGLQFLSTSLNCFLWIGYSFFSKNNTMLLTNSIGLLLSSYYVYNYLIYSGKSAKDYLHKIMITCVLAILIIFFSFVGTNEDQIDIRSNRLGLQASIICVLMFASPLEKIIQIIKIKNSEGMIKGTAVLSIMCSLSWLIFGLLINDKYIYVPNFLACLLAIIQLSIIFKFPPPNQQENNNKSLF